MGKGRQTSEHSLGLDFGEIFHGMIATSEDVITTRLTLSTFAADFKIPTVPLTAGWIKSRSYSVV